MSAEAVCQTCGGIGRVEGPLRLDAFDIWDCPHCDGTGYVAAPNGPEAGR